MEINGVRSMNSLDFNLCINVNESKSIFIIGALNMIGIAMGEG